MDRTRLSKSVISILLTIYCFCCTYLAEGAVPQGHDFTVPANSPYKEGQLLVRFAKKIDGTQHSATEKNQVLSALGGGTIERDYKIVPGLSLVKLPTGLTVKDALKTYNARDEILYAEPDYKIYLLSKFPNDPNFSKLWGLHNAGQAHPLSGEGFSAGTPDADIDAPEAWDIATGSNYKNF
jgi:hypothetical protein